MKKILVFLCTVSLFFGVVSFAGATPITFSDTISFSELLISPDESFSWTHEFDESFDEILSGSLTVLLIDDDDPLELEFGLGWGEDGTWAFGEVDTGSYSYVIDALFLADGTFTVTLLSLFGDFFLDQSTLAFTYENSSTITAPVPEPSTMLLLGFGLVGLAAVGRKRFH